MTWMASIDNLVQTLINIYLKRTTQSAITWSKLAIETLEQGLNYVQS